MYEEKHKFGLDTGAEVSYEVQIDYETEHHETFCRPVVISRACS
jgi:hypothetical protein